MAHTNYIKQDLSSPAFSELLWSKPEHISARGKLLIIGGNTHGLTAPMKAYEYAVNAGIGHPRVLLPASLKQFAGTILEHGEYAPYTPSGSFSKQALDTALDNAAWADVTLLAGDIGRNSETSMMFASFLRTFKGQVAVAKDGVNAVMDDASALAKRDNTTLVLVFSQLQKLIQKLAPDVALTVASSAQNIADVLGAITAEHAVTIVTASNGTVYVSSKGKVSITTTNEQSSMWALHTASHVSVWLAQQPEKVFEAVTTAIYASVQSGNSSSE